MNLEIVFKNLAIVLTGWFREIIVYTRVSGFCSNIIKCALNLIAVVNKSNWEFEIAFKKNWEFEISIKLNNNILRCKIYIERFNIFEEN